MLENLVINSASFSRVFAALLAVCFLSYIVILIAYNRFYKAIIQNDNRNKKCRLTPKRFSVISLIAILILLGVCMVTIHLKNNAPYEFPDSEHKIELMEKSEFDSAIKDLALIESFCDEKNTYTEIFSDPGDETEVYIRKYYNGAQVPKSAYVIGSYHYKAEIHFGTIWEKSISEGTLKKTLLNPDEVFIHLVNLDPHTYISVAISWMDYVPETTIEMRSEEDGVIVPYSEQEHILDCSSDYYFIDGIHGEAEERIWLNNSNIAMYSSEQFQIPDSGYYVLIIVCAALVLGVACWWAK